MASGFSRVSKANSTKSLGSFVDIASAASSEFEPVDFEDIELSSMAARNEGIVGKNKTPDPAPLSATRSESDGDAFEEGTSVTTRCQDAEAGGNIVLGRHLVQRSATRCKDAEAGRNIVLEGRILGLEDILCKGQQLVVLAGPSVQHIVDPLQEGLQNFEQATQKAAEAAKDFTNKLWVSGTAEAKSSVMRLAGDVSSWWATLDPGAPSSADKPQDSARSAQGNEQVQALFDLTEDEELMEKFSCTLIQTLQCTHNTVLKPQQIRTAGKLYITDKHTCFEADENKFAIPHSNIKKVTKAAGKSSALNLELKTPGEYVRWEGFRGSDLESALGLLEHLTT